MDHHQDDGEHHHAEDLVGLALHGTQAPASDWAKPLFVRSWEQQIEYRSPRQPIVSDRLKDRILHPVELSQLLRRFPLSAGHLLFPLESLCQTRHDLRREEKQCLPHGRVPVRIGRAEAAWIGEVGRQSRERGRHSDETPRPATAQEGSREDGGSVEDNDSLVQSP